MRIKSLKKGFEKLTKEKARIIAHLIGDGTLYKTSHDYVLKYEVNDEELLIQFENDIKKVYGLNTTHYFNPSGFTKKPIKAVRLRSKLAYEDLLRYATYFSKDWKLKDEFLKSDKKIKREFIKALYDDEGSVKSRYELALYSINKEGLLQIQIMLKEFEINSRISSGYGLKRNVYAIIISDFIKFNKEIGFNLKRKQEKLKNILKTKSKS